MAMLRMAGWRVDVLSSRRPRKTFTYQGEIAPRYNNEPVRGRHGIERGWTLRTGVLDQFCADTLEGLLEGKSHHLPFVVDAWSESGMGPESGGTFTINSSGGPVATRGYYVTVGGSPLVYDAELIDDQVAPDGGRWGVLWWELVSGEWVRRCLRSDGTKFQNGASTTASFTAVTVADGVVTLSSGAEVADLSTLQFYPCDDFIADDYEWVSGSEMVFYAPLSDSFSDIVGSRSGIPTGITFAKGQVKRGAFGNAAGDAINFGTDSDLIIFGKTARTWEMWVEPDSLVAGMRLFSNDSGAAGHVANVFTGTDRDIAVNLTVRYSTTDMNIQADAFDLDGLEHHLAFVWDDTTKLGAVYVDGQLVPNNISETIGDGTISDDTGLDFYLMNDVGGALGFRGTMDDFRMGNRRLTAAQIQERYDIGRASRYVPGPRFFSALPRVELFGDIDGTRAPVEVIGSVTDENYQSHGDDDGGAWVKSDRVLDIELDDVKYRPKHRRLPRPDVAYAYASRFIKSPAAAASMPAPFASPFTQSGVGMDFANRGQRGPFGYPDAAYLFSGDYADINSADVAQFFYGARGATLAAWVRPTSLAANAEIFGFHIDNAGNARVALEMLAGGTIRLNVRSELADATQTGISTGSIPVDEWSLVVASVDLQLPSIKTYINGVLDDDDVFLTFGQVSFSGEGPTTAPYANVGADRAGGTTWPGQIAGVYGWRYALPAGQVRTMYELGRKGVFS